MNSSVIDHPCGVSIQPPGARSRSRAERLECAGRRRDAERWSVTPALGLVGLWYKGDEISPLFATGMRPTASGSDGRRRAACKFQC